LARVWRASEELGTFGKIVRLLILTAQRKSEIAELHPSYFHDGLIIWPSSVTKNGREPALPASPAVHALAAELAAIVAVKPFTTLSKPKIELDRLSGVTDWTLHDLRRTAATGMAKLSVAPHVVERILNHASGTFAGVAGIYNRFRYLDEMRTALSSWESCIAALAKTAEVTAMSASQAPLATVG
jgi:integrase